MGNLFGRKRRSRVTEQDKAVLQLKQQRDKLKQYQKRISVQLERERAFARQLLKDGKKEWQVQDIEFTQIEMKVIEGLKIGNECLNKMHQVMSIEEVERIMDETQEAVEYQRGTAPNLLVGCGHGCSCKEEEEEEEKQQQQELQQENPRGSHSSGSRKRSGLGSPGKRRQGKARRREGKQREEELHTHSKALRKEEEEEGLQLHTRKARQGSAAASLTATSSPATQDQQQADSQQDHLSSPSTPTASPAGWPATPMGQKPLLRQLELEGAGEGSSGGVLLVGTGPCSVAEETFLSHFCD
ncbi:hypothetical protein JD844_011384 [Phrynosoma platyrhinos]|uniref:Charged multivesicular body protein 6 n=1 Tax=Phrynosoma platyrhinos TaxID=52577 RepID=A0ABQ7TIW3_PHRPL|nr:hypothetical protein JD844_011384 [Phrynosoma platyrhinos]